jgi:hypothetical protein
MNYLKNNKLVAVAVAALIAALTSFYLGVWGGDEVPAEPAAPVAAEPVAPAVPAEQPVPNFGAPTDTPAAPAAPAQPAPDAAATAPAVSTDG